MKFTVLDFETTGLGPLDEIITGHFDTFDREGNTIDELNIKLKPTRWSTQAEEIHKIPKQLAMQFPDRTPVLREVAKYIKKHRDTVFICHANHQNLRKDPKGKVIGNSTGYFDWEMLRCNFFHVSDDAYWYFNKLVCDIDVVSTHTIAKNVISLQKYRLPDLAGYYGLSFNHHNCKEDALVTKKVFLKMLDVKNISLEELINVGRYDKTTRIKRLPG